MKKETANARLGRKVRANADNMTSDDLVNMVKRIDGREARDRFRFLTSDEKDIVLAAVNLLAAGGKW